MGEYGIIANVEETDRVFRKGSKAWIVDGTGGEGWYRFQWLGRSRSGSVSVQWKPTHRFANFRAAWVPPWVRSHREPLYISGTREEMEEEAKALNEFADRMREEHPNRGQRS